ncbi:hypothetical protein BDR03DRAFT_1016677 [Suillus americanus]|nr:hypothetical protein BDR03DRAFT_1016677 [Suillus americanus]
MEDPSVQLPSKSGWDNHPPPLPGCINILPAWFQQGREKYGFPNLDLEDGFLPEVSAILKGDASRGITTSLQRVIYQ